MRMQKDTKYCIRCRKRVAGDCYGYRKEKSVCNDNRVQEEQPGAYPGGRVPQFPGAGKGTVHCKSGSHIQDTGREGRSTADRWGSVL